MVRGARSGVAHVAAVPQFSALTYVPSICPGTTVAWSRVSAVRSVSSGDGTSHLGSPATVEGVSVLVSSVLVVADVVQALK